MQKYGTGPSGDFHARYGGADGVKGGGQVDGDDRVPLVDRKLLDRRNMLDASIVHQYVERAERRLMLGHHFGDLVGPGHVGGRIAGGHAELRFQSGALLFDGGRLAKADRKSTRLNSSH